MLRSVGRVGRIILVAVTAATIAAGCAQTVEGTAQRADPGAIDPDRSYGYLDDRCGLLDDSTVQTTLDADEITRPFSGAVCQYILSRRSTGGAANIDVTFSWFESGSLDRERALADARGANVTDMIVERHKAFSARRDTTGAACSATAMAGKGVVSWWVQYRGQSSGDPCVDAEKLLSATLRSDM